MTTAAEPNEWAASRLATPLLGCIAAGLGLWAGWLAVNGVFPQELRLAVTGLVVALVASVVQWRRGDIVSYWLLLAGVAVSSVSGAVAIRDASGLDHDGPVVIGTLVAATVAYLFAARTSIPRRRNTANYAVLIGTAIGVLGVFTLPDPWRIAAAVGLLTAGVAAAKASRPLPDSALVASTVNCALAVLFILG